MSQPLLPSRAAFHGAGIAQAAPSALPELGDEDVLHEKCRGCDQFFNICGPCDSGCCCLVALLLSAAAAHPNALGKEVLMLFLCLLEPLSVLYNSKMLIYIHSYEYLLSALCWACFYFYSCLLISQAVSKPVQTPVMVMSFRAKHS